MNRIKIKKRGDRPTLNERPIYLTFVFLFMAAAQSSWHLYYDYDRIDMPVLKTKPTALPEGETPPTNQIGPVQRPFVQLSGKAGKLVLSAGARAMVTSALALCTYWVGVGIPFVLTINIRAIAWGFTRSWATIFWNLPKSGALPAYYPWHISVLLRSFTGGTLLFLLWEVANAAFSAYVAQEPLKDGRPITYESRDPNGSLLTGLNGKKLQTRVSKHLTDIRPPLRFTRLLLSGNWFSSQTSSKVDVRLCLKTSIELGALRGPRFRKPVLTQSRE